ncbi:MAG: AroM family protein [Clostridium fessum]
MKVLNSYDRAKYKMEEIKMVEDESWSNNHWAVCFHRADVVQELLPLMGEQVELIQAGALDGLTREDIQGICIGPERIIL